MKKNSIEDGIKHDMKKKSLGDETKYANEALLRRTPSSNWCDLETLDAQIPAQLPIIQKGQKTLKVPIQIQYIDSIVVLLVQKQSQALMIQKVQVISVGFMYEQLANASSLVSTRTPPIVSRLSSSCPPDIHVW